MGLPFIITEGTSLIVNTNGDIADVVANIAGKNRIAVDSSIVGNDGLLRADVELVSGKNRLLTDSIVTVEQIFGFDDFADTWFSIDEAGDLNDTVRIQIAAFIDPTATERNKPAVDLTYTLLAEDVDDEIKLRDNLIAALNADANFIAAQWKANPIKANPIIHIGSKTIGEEGERPVSGDFIVTPTGATLTSFQNSDNDRLIRRGKQNSGAKDPRDRRLVTIGISGEVQAVPGAAGDIFAQNATDDGTPIPDQGGTGDADLQVNGSLGSPIEFFIPPNADKDIFITELRFYGGGNGIQFTKFLSQNSALTNGVVVEITSDQQTLSFLPIRTTEDFKNKFAFGSGSNTRIDIQSGADQALFVLIFDNPFPIRKTGTFITGEDRVSVFVRDNLTSGMDEFEFIAVGFLREV